LNPPEIWPFWDAIEAFPGGMKPARRSARIGSPTANRFLRLPAGADAAYFLALETEENEP
jgi:hypothetical protein